MRRGVLVLLIAAAAGCSAAALAGDAAEPVLGWDELKSLVGTWEGAEAGHAHGVSVTYRLVSNGSALMESMDVPGHSETMVTMYAPDSPTGRIVATHYCAAGNQPRMAAKRIRGDTLDFQFLDATNAGAESELMRSLRIRFLDPDHFEQLWTSRSNGRDHAATFTWARKKK